MSVTNWLPRNRIAVLIGLLSVLPAAGPGEASEPAIHDKPWWQAVIADDFAPPAATSMDALLRELNSYLASPDPELRDDIAYRVLANWLYVQRIVPPERAGELIATWRRNLRHGIGERGTDSVFRRSFSALMLSVAAALDNQAPYLDAGAFERLLEAALQYLHDERDTRGFDPEKGWMHSVAHTADLLKFLGRSRHLEAQDQAAILAAIAGKLDTLDVVLVHGEDERLARAVLSIVARPDADMTAFEAFLGDLLPSPPDGLPTPAELALNQNRRNLLVSLYAVLGTDKRELESLQDARDRVLAALQRS
jgi:Protein of unknown function (DUF2785)